MVKKRQVDALIPKLCMEMREKVETYGNETIFPDYCHSISGNFTNNFAEQKNKCNKPIRCLGPYTGLLRFLEDEERQFLVKKVLISDCLFPRWELYVPAYFNCPKIAKQRMMSSNIVQVVQTGASHDLTSRVTNLQHRVDYKVDLKKMECS